MEKRYCKKCGRLLDKEDIDYCKLCFEDENGISYAEYQKKLQDEIDNSYTNIIANKFRKWSNGIRTLGIIALIVFIVYAMSTESGIFVGVGIGTFLVSLANSLILLAVAEIIQKLQNIEDNTRK